MSEKQLGCNIGSENWDFAPVCICCKLTGLLETWMAIGGMEETFFAGEVEVEAIDWVVQLDGLDETYEDNDSVETLGEMDPEIG